MSCSRSRVRTQLTLFFFEQSKSRKNQINSQSFPRINSQPQLSGWCQANSSPAHDVIGYQSHNLSRWTADLLLSEGEVSNPSNRKRMPKKICDQWRSDKKDDVIDSDYDIIQEERCNKMQQVLSNSILIFPYYQCDPTIFNTVLSQLETSISTAIVQMELHQFHY